MRHIVICGLPGTTLFFHIIAHKARFWRKVFEHKICRFSLKRLSETYLILGRRKRNTIRTVYWSSRIVPVILVIFQWKLDFLQNFRKTLKYQISWKSAQWKPSCSIPRRIDETRKLIVAFRNFGKAPKKKESCRVSGIWSRKLYYPNGWENGTKIISEFEQKGSSENKGISKALTKLRRRGAAEVVYATKQWQCANERSSFHDNFCAS